MSNIDASNCTQFARSASSLESVTAIRGVKGGAPRGLFPALPLARPPLGASERLLSIETNVANWPPRAPFLADNASGCARPQLEHSLPMRTSSFATAIFSGTLALMAVACGDLGANSGQNGLNSPYGGNSG